MRRTRLLATLGLAALVTAGATAAAQTPIYTSSIRAFQVKVGPQTIVRGKNGDLYLVYRDQFSPPQNDIAVARSTDDGATWNMNWQTGFATLAAGETGCLTPCIAIDGNDNLHVAWLHDANPPSTSRPPRTIRYNRFDANTQTWGTEVNLSPSASYTRPEPVLAVDPQNYVWIFHGTTGWASTMVRSAQPFAATATFNATSPSFNFTGAAQHGEVVFDSLGRVHVSFYSTANGATVHHMWMDPAAASPAWSSATPLGNNNAQADYYSSMCSDAAGNVFMVYGVDVQQTKTADPEWFIRKWDGSTQTWGTAVSIYKVQRSVYEPAPGSHNDGRVISAACDVVSGEVYFIYRDFDNGNLILARWADGDTAHTVYANLANTGTLPANSRNYLFYPQIRGSQSPTSNQAGIRLDILFTVGDQTATTPSYQLMYDSFHVGSLTAGGPPQIGTTVPLSVTAVEDGGLNYQIAMSLTGITPGLPVDRRFIPLIFDPLVLITVNNVLPTVFQNFAGVLPAAGVSTAQLNIPNAAGLVGIKVSGAFVTYPGGPAGIESISNPLRLTMIP